MLYDFHTNNQKSHEQIVKESKNIILGSGWNKHWSLFPPHPHPHPQRQQKTLPGGKQIKKKHILMISMIVMKTIRQVINESFKNQYKS